jgi:hypothetical protein
LRVREFAVHAAHIIAVTAKHRPAMVIAFFSKFPQEALHAAMDGDIRTARAIFRALHRLLRFGLLDEEVVMFVDRMLREAFPRFLHHHFKKRAAHWRLLTLVTELARNRVAANGVFNADDRFLAAVLTVVDVAADYLDRSQTPLVNIPPPDTAVWRFDENEIAQATEFAGVALDFLARLIVASLSSRQPNGVTRWATRPSLFRACVTLLTITRGSTPALRSAAMDAVAVVCALTRRLELQRELRHSTPAAEVELRDIGALYSSDRQRELHAVLCRTLRTGSSASVIAVMNFIASVLESQPDFGFGLLQGEAFGFVKGILDSIGSMFGPNSGGLLSDKDSPILLAVSRVVLSMFTNLSSYSRVVLSLITTPEKRPRIDIIRDIWRYGVGRPQRSADPTLVAAQANFLRAYALVAKHIDVGLDALRRDSTIIADFIGMLMPLRTQWPSVGEMAPLWTLKTIARARGLHVDPGAAFYFDPAVVAWLAGPDLRQSAELLNLHLWAVNAVTQFAASTLLFLPIFAPPANIPGDLPAEIERVRAAFLEWLDLPLCCLPLSTVKILFRLLESMIELLNWPPDALVALLDRDLIERIIRYLKHCHAPDACAQIYRTLTVLLQRVPSCERFGDCLPRFLRVALNYAVAYVTPSVSRDAPERLAALDFATEVALLLDPDVDAPGSQAAIFESIAKILETVIRTDACRSALRLVGVVWRTPAGAAGLKVAHLFSPAVLSAPELPVWPLVLAVFLQLPPSADVLWTYAWSEFSTLLFFLGARTLPRAQAAASDFTLHLGTSPDFAANAARRPSAIGALLDAHDAAFADALHFINERRSSEEIQAFLASRLEARVAWGHLFCGLVLVRNALLLRAVREALWPSPTAPTDAGDLASVLKTVAAIAPEARKPADEWAAITLLVQIAHAALAQFLTIDANAPHAGGRLAELEQLAEWRRMAFDATEDFIRPAHLWSLSRPEKGPWPQFDEINRLRDDLKELARREAEDRVMIGESKNKFAAVHATTHEAIDTGGTADALLEMLPRPRTATL